MMDQKSFEKHMTEKSEISKKIGFERWLAAPETRALISMIPASENKDLVHLVLQSAYNSGFASGQIVTVVEIIKVSGGLR